MSACGPKAKIAIVSGTSAVGARQTGHREDAGKIDANDPQQIFAGGLTRRASACRILLAVTICGALRLLLLSEFSRSQTKLQLSELARSAAPVGWPQ
jgi:hypothetical protein